MSFVRLIVISLLLIESCATKPPIVETESTMGGSGIYSDKARSILKKICIRLNELADCDSEKLYVKSTIEVTHDDYYYEEEQTQFSVPLVLKVCKRGFAHWFKISKNNFPIIGVSLEGLSTTVFPATNAAEVIPTRIAKGKFQGGITAKTPSGI